MVGEVRELPLRVGPRLDAARGRYSSSDSPSAEEKSLLVARSSLVSESDDSPDEKVQGSEKGENVLRSGASDDV